METSSFWATAPAPSPQTQPLLPSPPLPCKNAEEVQVFEKKGFSSYTHSMIEDSLIIIHHNSYSRIKQRQYISTTLLSYMYYCSLNVSTCRVHLRLLSHLINKQVSDVSCQRP